MRLFKKDGHRYEERLKAHFERHRRIYKLLKRYGEDIINSENFKMTKGHLQHGSMTVNGHCMNVARYSLILNKKLGLHCNKRDLVRGSLLHDYFLYDWHDKEYLAKRQRLHGFHHPRIALQNADKEYDLTDIQRDIIKKHMWPLSVVPPACREAWVVTAADKYCSLMETIGVHKGHGKQIGA
ncbi:MAG: HD domain-containing protein [Muribaculaceae bacterium]|nr:HD domain-containing protein [Muribaculaceae bacterium]